MSGWACCSDAGRPAVTNPCDLHQVNLVSVERAHVRYAEKVVLDGVSLGIDDGERVGVIGRNGSGKSTLLRVLAGVQAPDDGAVVHAGRLDVQLVRQEVGLDTGSTALNAVLDADSMAGRVYRRFSADPSDPQSTAVMAAHGLWDFEHVARALLDRFDVAAEQVVGRLSGGQRMRVALARGLVHSDVAARTGDTVPLLILDEPTNHLDLGAIEWLEERLGTQRGAVVLVTHDRYLLDRTVTRIVEVADGALHTEHGSYADHLVNRAARAQRAASRERRRRQLVRTELDWLQRSPPARTGKSRARIERAVALLDAEAPPTDPDVHIDLPTRRLGSRVATLRGVGRRYGDVTVLRDVTVNLQPGARIGIVGPNGSGKTTLLELLAGRQEPDQGSVRLGSTVQVGWYGQHTTAPPRGQRVVAAVSEVAIAAHAVGDTVGGGVSATALLERFGFAPAVQQAFVSELSGGERRRLELLRVLATAPNLLLLDEPTNDLDLDTLAVLEAALEHWPGTLVTASHDRFFLDRVCRQLWSIEPDGTLRDHPGGWTAYRAHHAAIGGQEAATRPAKPRPQRTSTRPGRLSYNEQRELHSLERVLPALEQRRDQLHAALVEAGDDHVRAGDLAVALDAVVAQIDRQETRWLELTLRTDTTQEQQ